MNLDISAPARPRGAKRDYRIAALALTIAGIAVLGYLVSLMPGRGVVASATKTAPRQSDFSTLPPSSPETRRAAAEQEVELDDGPANAHAPTSDPKTAQTNRILKEANAKIKARRYEEAITYLHAEQARIQHDPRSYVSMARALEGRGDYATARDFYAAAINKDPYFANAYFGLATASEAMGDLEAAIGGMRNYLHVQGNPDPARLKVAQARSAIWEWESQLGRGAWGPTKGIPPGFTAEELKRDGRGVGIKMPIPGTAKPDGSVRYEIKHQDKFQIFKP